jgi:hypothetical protein
MSPSLEALEATRAAVRTEAATYATASSLAVPLGLSSPPPASRDRATRGGERRGRQRGDLKRPQCRLSSSWRSVPPRR